MKILNISNLIDCLQISHIIAKAYVSKLADVICVQNAYTLYLFNIYNIIINELNRGKKENNIHFGVQHLVF